VVGPYWAFERSHIDQHYKSIDLNIEEVAVEELFSSELEWDLNHVEGYLNSWSAVQNYKKANNGKNPVPECIEELRFNWEQQLKIRIPIFLRMGRRAKSSSNEHV